MTITPPTLASVDPSRPSFEWIERRWRCMGSAANVGVVVARAAVGATPLHSWLDRAEARLAELEQRWSRFVPSSDVCRINAAGPWAEPVHPDTLELVATLRRGWVDSSGAFDPTMLPALEALGYRESFETLPAPGPSGLADGEAFQSRRAPGLDGLVLDRSACTVRHRVGCRIDPGGVGKGLAADMVVAELLDAGREHGVVGVLVDPGGDIAVGGTPPDDGRGWPIRLHEPGARPGQPAVVVDLTVDRACATTTNRRRRWGSGPNAQHHLVDPSTGVPVSTARSWSPSVVTALAPSAARAEIATKTLFVLAGRGRSHAGLDRVARRLGVVAVLVTEADERVLLGDAPVGHVHLAEPTSAGVDR